MSAARRSGCLFALALLAACRSVADTAGREAILLDPDIASRAELRTTVAAMLNAPSVTLADDALTADSLLVVEKAHPRDAAGIALSGRDFGRPEQFRLLKIGSDCVLVHLHSAARRVLQRSRCVPAK